MSDQSQGFPLTHGAALFNLQSCDIDLVSLQEKDRNDRGTVDYYFASFANSSCESVSLYALAKWVLI